MHVFFIAFVLLALFSTLLNKAPHSIAMALLLLTCLVYLYTFRDKVKLVYKKHYVPFLALFSFMLIFIAINFIHFYFSKDFFYALKRIRWTAYALVLIPCLTIFVNEYNWTNKKHLKIIIYAFLFLTSAFLCMIFADSLYKYLTSESTFATWFSMNKATRPLLYNTRASWSYNPIHFSRLMIFFSLLFSFIAFQHKKMGTYTKSFFVMISVFSFAVAILSQSRATYLGIICAFLALFVVMLFFYSKKTALSLFIAGVLSFFITMSASDTLRNRFTSIYTGHSFSNSYRLEIWKANAKLILKKPIMGVGNVENRKSSVIGKYLNEEKLINLYKTPKHVLYNHPHNTYLDIGSASGVSGVAFLLFLLFYPKWILFKKFKDNEASVLEAYLLFFLVYFSVVIFFEEIPFYNWFVVILSWFLVLNSQTIKEKFLHNPSA